MQQIFQVCEQNAHRPTNCSLFRVLFPRGKSWFFLILDFLLINKCCLPILSFQSSQPINQWSTPHLTQTYAQLVQLVGGAAEFVGGQPFLCGKKEAKWIRMEKGNLCEKNAMAFVRSNRMFLLSFFQKTKNCTQNFTSFSDELEFGIFSHCIKLNFKIFAPEPFQWTLNSTRAGDSSQKKNGKIPCVWLSDWWDGQWFSRRYCVNFTCKFIHLRFHRFARISHHISSMSIAHHFPIFVLLLLSRSNPKNAKKKWR